MGILDSFGGFIQKLPGFKQLFEEDAKEKQKDEVLEAMLLDYRKKHKPKKKEVVKEKEEPAPPKIDIKPPKNPPTLTKKYEVYLIMPEYMTTHTTLQRFIHKTKQGSQLFYYLNYNKRFYKEEEIEGLRHKHDWEAGDDGNLVSSSSNFIFMDSYGNLSIGSAEFSDNAKREIQNAERTKLKDRALVNTNLHLRNKYRLNDNFFLVLQLVLLAFGIGMLAWFFFPGLISVIDAELRHAEHAWKTKHSPIELQLNNTAVVYYYNQSNANTGSGG